MKVHDCLFMQCKGNVPDRAAAGGCAPSANCWDAGRAAIAHHSFAFCSSDCIELSNDRVREHELRGGKILAQVCER